MYFNRDKKHYYNMDIVYNHFKDSKLAIEYLTGIVEDSSPDFFHWTDIDEANKLMAQEFKKV